MVDDAVNVSVVVAIAVLVKGNITDVLVVVETIDELDDDITDVLVIVDSVDVSMVVASVEVTNDDNVVPTAELLEDDDSNEHGSGCPRNLRKLASFNRAIVDMRSPYLE